MSGGAGTPQGEGAPSLPGRIVLVGSMGAGKTTVGRLLAGRLGYGFADLDEEVERAGGRPVAEIFRTAGEAEFRRREAEATVCLDDRIRVVVATGGGWMTRPELRDRWPGAVRVWLEASPESVLRRLGGRYGTRPLLARGSPEEALRAILTARAPAYSLAEIRVDTDGRTAVDVARRILDLLGGGPGGRRPPPQGTGRDT